MQYYSQLPHEQQRKFMEDLKAFSLRGMLLINRLSRPNEMPLLMRAFNFIEIYGVEQDWIGEIRSTGNYPDSVTKVKEIITAIVKGKLSPKYVDVPTARRGRPTKEQQAARAAAKEAQRKEQEDTGLFRQEEMPEPVVLPAFDMPLVLRGEGVSMHLDQLAFLLTESLAKQVTGGNIRSLRRQFEDSYAQAKALALKGKEEEASEYAVQARDLNNEIEAIYQQVDEEMAANFIRLKDDDAFIKEITAKVRDVKEIIALCRPYYKKVSEAQPDFADKVRENIRQSSPEAVAAREAEKERRRAAAAIIKYLRRTDKPNTDKRIATMTAKLEELRSLIGSEADAYLPLLEKAKEDNVRSKVS